MNPFEVPFSSVVTERAHVRRNNFLSDYVCLFHVQLFFFHPENEGDDIDGEKKS